MPTGVPAHERSAGPLQALLGGLLLCAASSTAIAQDQYRMVFDIPAQPLADALTAYAGVVGIAALVDRDLVTGRRSAPVKGLLTGPEALQILVAGTGLAIRYTSRSTAVTLVPGASVTGMAPVGSGLGVGRDDNYRAYFADVQSTLEQVLCRSPETRPGRYRVGVQLWIGANGAIRAAHLFGSTGDGQRDAVLSKTMEGAVFNPPPASLPQPVTVVLLPASEEGHLKCGEGARLRQ